MPWFLEPVPVTSGIDWLVSLLRMGIADQKTSVNNVVMEINDETSSGSDTETFYTDWLPISSGANTYMRIDRWLYSEYDTVAEVTGEPAKRGYIFNEASGAFWIPSGAIPGVNGGKVYLSYSWEEEQTYTHQDEELRLYLQDSISEVNNGYYNFGFSTSGAGSSFDVYPNPGINDVASYIYVKYATYLLKKRQESEGFDNRIYVRDLNVTIDTAKGLGDLSKSANDLLNEIKDISLALTIKGQEAAFAKIDTYSTYVSMDGSDNYAHRYQSDSDVF